MALPIDLIGLSEEDIAILKYVVEREKQRVLGKPARSVGVETSDLTTPEVYLVKAPSGGIPATTVGDTTPVETECNAYRISEGEIEQLDGVTVPAVNISPSSITTNAWAVAFRDKFGDWYALSVPSGTGGSTLTVTDSDTSITPVDTITVDKSTGISLEEEEYSGQADIVLLAATASQWGVVSTTTQTLGGDKTFKAETLTLEALDATTVPNIQLILNYGTAGAVDIYGEIAFQTGGTDRGYIRSVIDGDIYILAKGGIYEGELQLSPNYNLGGVLGYRTVLALRTQGSGITGYPVVVLQDNDGSPTQRDGAMTGATTVLACPAQITGGIVTGITELTDPGADRIPFWDDSNSWMAWLEAGTGLSISGTTISCTVTAYTTENAQDDIGGILVDSSTIDFTYDDGVPSITASVIDDSITNAKLANAAAYSIKANLTSGSANPTDAALADITTATPVAGDFVVGFLDTGEVRKFDVDDLMGGSGSPGGSDTHVQFNDGGSFGGEAAFAYDKTTNQLTVPGLTLTEDLLMSAIYDSGSSNLNDYNPTGLSTANTIIYTAGAAIDLTGIAGGATDRVLYFFNNSPYTVTVKYVSGSSSSGNQFVTPDAADYALPRLSGMMIRWESSYWLIVAGSGGSGGGGSYTDEAAQDAVGAMADSNTLTYTDATPLLAVKTQMSVTSDSSGLKLSGDSGSPGNSKLYGTDGSGTKGWYSQPSGGSTADIICLRDEQSSGTDGGTFTSGAWRTRTLNTEATDTGSNCTLSSNQFTLAAGTYEIEASAPAAYCARHQARLYNATDTSVIIVGTSEYCSAADSAEMPTRSFIRGRFTIGASKALEIQHQCGSTRATNGFGVADSFTTEVYTIVWLRRVA